MKEQENENRQKSKLKEENTMDGKLIRVDAETHETMRLEAVRQSMKPNTVVTMGDVIAQYAKKLKRNKTQEIK